MRTTQGSPINSDIDRSEPMQR